MARLILGVTGSVAAIRAPALYRDFTASGHDVRVVATRPALYFFDPSELRPAEAPPEQAARRLSRTSHRSPAARFWSIKMNGPETATSATIRSCTSSCASGPTS